MQKEKQQKTRQQALSELALCLAVTTVGLFLISPLLQMLMRLLDMTGPNGFTYSDGFQGNHYHVQKMYHNMVDSMLMAGRFLCVPLAVYVIYAAVRSRKAIAADRRETFVKLLPYGFFCCLSGASLRSR